ncbi:ATP-dependent DNA helicase [Neolentinus lepideus HHB14362 ss-1]|uniref:ATP-dependent DNA helicase n=1 Tax=Neolentinus lepideus HHB14362 ss-1 TaxID=1314782 RepID=A0A165NXI2_9AGAM|nr:ATP-dependent DNA helicase [Neolentinus lepideus HHB14362 ss-1]
MAPAVEKPTHRSVSDSNIVPIYDREPIKNSPYLPEIMEKLNTIFGMRQFRKNQLEVITATLDGRDVLVLMPTGGGKSLCYQLPAICQTGKTRGVTVVISPLLALMRDQEQSLLSKGIDVVNFSSDQSDEANSDSWAKLNGRNKPSIMYVTPEKLESSSKMKNTLQRVYEQGQLARFVIDEAHVISSWGRNFRTAYKNLDSLRRHYPTVPIMALTATANSKTRRDIIDRLGIQGCEVLLQSFNRPNLHYSVRPKSGKTIVCDIATYIKSRHSGETGIIYCLSRDKCEEVAKELRDKYNLRARHFHAKMNSDDKQRTQKGWQDGDFEIIVATIAFGMGIDKHDVRFVIHHTLSRSLDSYAQETGRAGRDGLPSDCLLFYSSQDVNAIMSQIRNDKDLTPDVAQLQIDELWQMSYFCQNDVDCRRKELMAFFDQVFDPRDCHKSCNNCVEVKELKQENLTRQASDAVRLLQMMLRRDTHISHTLCVAAFRGSKSSDVTKKGFDGLSPFGAGKDLPAKLVQRLFAHLYSRRAFSQEPQSNGMWNSNYMQVSMKHIRRWVCHEPAVARRKSGCLLKRQRGSGDVSRCQYFRFVVG